MNNVELKRYKEKYEYDFDADRSYLFMGQFLTEADLDSYALSKLSNQNLAFGYYGDNFAKIIINGTGVNISISKREDDPLMTLLEIETPNIGDYNIVRRNVYGNDKNYRFKQSDLYIYDETGFVKTDIFKVSGIYATLQEFKDDVSAFKIDGTYGIINTGGRDGHIDNPENSEYYVYLETENKYIRVEDIQYDKIQNVSYPVSGSYKLDESLDEIAYSTKFSTDESRLIKGDKVSLFIDGVEDDIYFVEQENVVDVERYSNNGVVNKDTSLVENIKGTEGDIISGHTYSFFKPAPKSLDIVKPEDDVAINTAQEFIDKIKANPLGTYVILSDLDFSGIDYKPLLFSGKLIGYKRDVDGKFDGSGEAYSLNNITINVKQSNFTPTSLITKGFALGIFSILEGAVISGININNLRISENDGSSSEFVLYNKSETKGRQYSVGGLAGVSTRSDITDLSMSNVSIKIDYKYQDIVNYGFLFLLSRIGSYDTRTASLIGTSILDTIKKVDIKSFDNSVSGEILNSIFGAIYYANIEQYLSSFIAVSSSSLVENCSLSYNGSYSKSKYSSLQVNQTRLQGHTSLYHSDFICPPSTAVVINSYSAVETETNPGTGSVNGVTVNDIDKNINYTNYYSNSSRTNGANVVEELNGEGKTLSELEDQGTYNDFDFDSTWTTPTTGNTPNILFDDVNSATIFEGTYTLKQAIQRAVDIIEIRRNMETSVSGVYSQQKSKYSVSDNLDKVNIIIPELFFNPISLSDFLFTIGGIINGIPILKGGNVIDFLLLNRDSDEYIEKARSGQLVSQPSGSYASEIVSFNDNVVNDVIKTTDTIKQLQVYPSLDNWITPRSIASEDYRILNSTSAIILPNGIENVFKFEMFIDETVLTKGSALGGAPFETVLDITSNINSKEQYELLENTESGKGRVLIFNQYDNKIIGFDKSPIAGFTPSFPAMRTILAENGFIDAGDTSTTINFNNIRFRVYYNPIFNNTDTTVRTFKDGSFRNEFKSIINQSQNVTSATKLADNKQFRLRKTGLVDITRSYVINNYSDIPKLGDLIEIFGDKYYCSVISFEINSTIIRLDVSYTKDFNNISRFIGQDKRSRAFLLPTNNIQERKVGITEFIEISKTPNSNRSKGDYGTVSNVGLAVIAKPLTGNRVQPNINVSDNTTVSTAFLKTGSYVDTSRQSGLEYGEFAMQAVPYPTSNGLGFNIKFDSNVSAGLSGNSTSLIDGVVTPVSRDELYTRNGFMDYVEGIQLVDSYLANDKSSKELPLKTSNILTLDGDAINLQSLEGIENSPPVGKFVFKDLNEDQRIISKSISGDANVIDQVADTNKRHEILIDGEYVIDFDLNTGFELINGTDSGFDVGFYVQIERDGSIIIDDEIGAIFALETSPGEFTGTSGSDRRVLLAGDKIGFIFRSKQSLGGATTYESDFNELDSSIIVNLDYNETRPVIDFKNDRLNIFKDSREILNISLNYQYITDDKNIIINKNLRDLCPIINGKLPDGYSVRVHAGFENIQQYKDVFVSGVDGETFAVGADYLVTTGTSSILLRNQRTANQLPTEDNDGNPLNYKSIIITDSRDKILLAFNNEFGASGKQLVTMDDIPDIRLNSLDNNYRK